ncbi:hypothetical protein GCM10023324_19640 [Streptomyces youssoufiensis]
MAVDIAVIRYGQMYRYDLRQTVVSDGRRPARTPLRTAQEQAGDPVGRRMGRGLASLGLALPLRADRYSRPGQRRRGAPGAPRAPGGAGGAPPTATRTAAGSEHTR